MVNSQAAIDCLVNNVASHACFYISVREKDNVGPALLTPMELRNDFGDTESYGPPDLPLRGEGIDSDG